MKTIPKNIRLVKLTRMLYQGQMFNTTEACSNIYGVDFTESQRRNIQNDFKFLNNTSFRLSQQPILRNTFP